MISLKYDKYISGAIVFFMKWNWARLCNTFLWKRNGKVTHCIFMLSPFSGFGPTVLLEENLFVAINFLPSNHFLQRVAKGVSKSSLRGREK